MFHTQMSRIRAVGLAVGALAVLATAGCAGNSGGTPAAGAGGEGSGELGGTVTVAYLSGNTVLPRAMEEFKKAHPGVTFRDIQAVSNTYQAQMRAQLDSGQGADVLHVWGGSGNAMAAKILGEAGRLADLSDEPWVSSTGAIANDLASYDGQVLALNRYQTPYGLVYNTDMFDKLGLEVPGTFSELLDLCKDVSAEGVVPIAVGAQTGYLATGIPLQLASALTYAEDPDFLTKITEGTEKWSTSKLWKDSLTKSLEEYMQMQEAGCFQDNTTGYSDTAVKQMVASEQALGTFIISNGIPTLAQQAPDMPLDMLMLPATDDPGDVVLMTNVGDSMAVNANSKNKDAAIAFIDYLGEPEQVASAAMDSIALPYTPADDTVIPDEVKGVEDLYREGKVVLLQTNFWPGFEVKQTMIAECQNLLTGVQTVEGAVDAIMAAFGDA